MGKSERIETSDRARRPRALAKYWTPEDDEILIRLRDQGVGHKEISALVGHPANSCSNRIVELKRRESMSEMERAALALNAKRAWTQADDAELMRLRDAGASYRAISEQINRTAGACEARARDLRLGRARIERETPDINTIIDDLRDIDRRLAEARRIAMSGRWAQVHQPCPERWWP